ncbi:MAG: CPBP family glutamic-type intramembrane protease [Thermoanaerobaculales bacterium]|nr:CPBP family glutamic-type intramembrane protease [Thermoanaerobaculales bacterium]
MTRAGGLDPGPIRAALLIHQEGVLAVIALIGLHFTSGGIAGGLMARGPWAWSIAVGAASGATCVVLLWSLREIPPLRRLEAWQRRIVGGWTATDAFCVALVSGLAEEALLRALLQPLIGLLPAAALFAALHVVPDRRLWLWPVFALGCGLGLGVLFDEFGFPAAAAAHVLINGVALLRLRGEGGG